MFGPCCVIRLCSLVLMYRGWSRAGGWESRGGESRDGSSPQTCAGIAGAAAVIYSSLRAWFGKLLNTSGVAERAGRWLQPGFIITSASDSPVLVYGAGLRVFLVYSHARPSCSLHVCVGMTATRTPFLANMSGGKRWTQPQIRHARVNLLLTGSWHSSSPVSCFE